MEPRDTSQELYQAGFNPFTVNHDVQLEYVLKNWAWMVQSGFWDVDEHGVAGGIEKWREADTEEHWAEYWLPLHW